RGRGIDARLELPEIGEARRALPNRVIVAAVDGRRLRRANGGCARRRLGRVSWLWLLRPRSDGKRAERGDGNGWGQHQRVWSALRGWTTHCDRGLGGSCNPFANLQTGPISFRHWSPQSSDDVR